jgi:hypothetical protein
MSAELLLMQGDGKYRRRRLSSVTLQSETGRMTDLTKFSGRIVIEEIGEEALVTFVRDRRIVWLWCALPFLIVVSAYAGWLICWIRLGH